MVDVPQDKANEVWLQAYELDSDFEDLSDEQLAIIRDVLHGRIKLIMELMHDYVPDDMCGYEASEPKL